MGDGGDRAARILAETPSRIGASVALGRRLFGTYIELFHSRRRRVALPSR